MNENLSINKNIQSVFKSAPMLPASYSLKRPIPHTTARQSFSMQQYSCYSNSGCIFCRTNDFIMLGNFYTGFCSKYFLSSEYARSCASFHSTCSDIAFLRRSDTGAEISTKARIWSL